MKIFKVFFKIIKNLNFLKKATKITFKKKQFREDLQKSLKSKKSEIISLHNEYFSMGNWMFEDLQKKNSNRNASYEERSPEEIPEENFETNKPQINYIQRKKSFNEPKRLNAYEMRENIPISTKNKKNNYNFDEENLAQEENTKEKPKFGFLKRKQKSSNQTEKNEKQQDLYDSDKNLKPTNNETLKLKSPKHPKKEPIKEFMKGPVNETIIDPVQEEVIDKNEEEIQDPDNLGSRFKFLKRKSQKMQSNKVYFLICSLYLIKNKGDLDRSSLKNRLLGCEKFTTSSSSG